MKKILLIAALIFSFIVPQVQAELNNITTEGVDGNWVIYDGSKNIIATFDATNRKLSIPSGSTLEVLGTASIVDGAIAAGDMALTTGSILLGASNKAAALDAKGDGKILIGNGTTAAMQNVSGDVTLTNAGAVTIGAKKVTAAKTAIADGKVLIGGADGAAAEQTLTGDVTVTNAGVTAIGAGKVTNAMLASGAGVGALLTAGLGGPLS